MCLLVLRIKQKHLIFFWLLRKRFYWEASKLPSHSLASDFSRAFDCWCFPLRLTSPCCLLELLPIFSPLASRLINNFTLMHLIFDNNDERQLTSTATSHPAGEMPADRQAFCRASEIWRFSERSSLLQPAHPCCSQYQGGPLASAGRQRFLL